MSLSNKERLGGTGRFSPSGSPAKRFPPGEDKGYVSLGPVSYVGMHGVGKEWDAAAGDIGWLTYDRRPGDARGARGARANCTARARAALRAPTRLSRSKGKAERHAPCTLR